MKDEIYAIIMNHTGVTIELLESTDYDSAREETEGFDDSNVYLASAEELMGIRDSIDLLRKGGAKKLAILK
jgi:hypothetical protein